MSFIFSAIGTMLGAENTAASLENNAKIADNNAQYAKDSAKIEEQKLRKQVAKFMGQQTVDYAAAGVDMSGSALWVRDESLANAELDAMTIRYQGDQQANDYHYQASMMRWQADNTRTGAVFEAAAQVMGGMAQQKTNAAAQAPNPMYGQSQYGIRPSSGYNLDYMGGGQGIRIK